MAWGWLVIAGILEVVWAFAMKESEGLTRARPMVLMIGAMVGSFGLLALAMRSLPLSVAYMLWTGIGALGSFGGGVWVLGEPLTVQKAVAAALILTGILTMMFSQ